MPSLRNKFFEANKVKKEHVSESDIRDLLIYINRLNSYTELSIHFNDELEDEKLFDSMFERLQNGEMIQYILGQADFYGEKFIVSKDVLIPRQETEELLVITLNLIKEKFKSKVLNIADVCTGSGILGISIKNNLPDSNVTVTDLSDSALEICKKNIAKFNQNIRVLRGNFIEPLLEIGEKFDVIICNPPYIENENDIDARTWEQEPHLALLAKPGTLFYEILIKNISKLMNEHYLIAFEIGEDLKDKLEIILEDNNLKGCYKFEKDIYGKDRFLFIMK